LKLLIRWAVGAAALYLTVLLAQALNIDLALKGRGVQGVVNAFIVVLALTLVNALVRPIVKLLTLPLNCLTFGLFSFVINALMFWLVGQLDVGLHVGRGPVPPLFGSIVMSLIGGILNTFVSEKDEDQR
jgi:putative membrane protein